LLKASNARTQASSATYSMENEEAHGYQIMEW